MDFNIIGQNKNITVTIVLLLFSYAFLLITIFTLAMSFISWEFSWGTGRALLISIVFVLVSAKLNYIYNKRNNYGSYS